MWQKALNLKAEEERLLPQESLAAVLGADTAAGMRGCCEHLAPLPAPVPVVSVPARGGCCAPAVGCCRKVLSGQ